jgi:hypothetical protein
MTSWPSRLAFCGVTVIYISLKSLLPNTWRALFLLPSIQPSLFPLKNGRGTQKPIVSLDPNEPKPHRYIKGLRRARDFAQLIVLSNTFLRSHYSFYNTSQQQKTPSTHLINNMSRTKSVCQLATDINTAPQYDSNDDVSKKNRLKQ